MAKLEKAALPGCPKMLIMSPPDLQILQTDELCKKGQQSLP